MLNHQSPIPLYHQLAEILIKLIRSGTFSVGEKIPSEHTLASKYGIGRPTVRQAIELLVRKRLLIKKRGSGTYVRKKDDEIDLLSLAGTTSAFQKKGISITTKILEKICLKSVKGNDENPFSRKEAYFYSRLLIAGDIPVLIEFFYLHPVLFAGIDRMDLSHRSLSKIVEENFYLRPINGKQTFRIGYLKNKMASELKLSSQDPILMVTRHLHFQQAKNAIYSELYCRTDPFVFSQSMGGLIYD